MLLPSLAAVLWKVTHPYTPSIPLPSQVLLISGGFLFLFLCFLKNSIQRKERNQNVLNAYECARHLGLAPLMSYLCDLHKSPKRRETCPVFHTGGYLNFVRGTL